MRVLLVTSVFPPDIGGPATYVPVMASYLTSRGLDVTVLTLAEDVARVSGEGPFLVERIARRGWAPWRFLLTVGAVVRLGRKADLLYVNGQALESGLANLWLRKPLVQKVVGDVIWERESDRHRVAEGFVEFQHRRYGVRVELLKRIRCWWSRQANTVIVPSRFLRDCVLSWGVSPERIVVIPNAVRVPSRVEPAVLPLQTKRKVVVVGRLVADKRVDEIIGAVARMPDTGLVIVGDGPEMSALKHRADTLGAGGRMYFAGRRSKEDVLSLMAACDALVLNSGYEGLPHVVLEALSLGLPVVATAVGGTPEVAEWTDAVQLVPPGEPERLLAGLEHVLSSQRRSADDRRRQANTSSERFDRMMCDTENVLRRTIG